MQTENFLLECAGMIPHPSTGGELPETMNKVQLNNVDHHALRVVKRYSTEFGHSVNQALLSPAEFEDAQREYPILFRRDGEGEFQAIVLLGLDRGENVFLAKDQWNARFIPAEIRRGPFFLGQVENGSGTATPAPFIDLEDPRVGKDEGEPLFLSLGGNTPYLEEVITALRTIRERAAESRAMFNLFLELELIQPVNIQIQLADRREYRIPEVFSIDTAQFSSLAPDKLKRLQMSGFLPHAIFARSSLPNVNRLIELKAAKLADD